VLGVASRSQQARAADISPVQEFQSLVLWWVSRILALLLVAAVMAVFIYLFVEAELRANDAREGKRVSPVKLLGVDVLDVRSEPAHVGWIGQRPPPGLGLSVRDCVSYLGEAGGTAVLYDAKRKEPIRVPSSAVAVRNTNCGDRWRPSVRIAYLTRQIEAAVRMLHEHPELAPSDWRTTNQPSDRSPVTSTLQL
jgi:hypothetical protein